MSQSRKGSMLETATNILIGYWINFFANLVVLPAFGYNVSVRDNLGIGIIYTVISIVRSYCLRRWFNGFVRRAS